jgi:hypothetical protein
MANELPYSPPLRRGRYIELRVGQIYQERGRQERRVQVVALRDDGSLVLQRIGPAPPRTLGRRSVRRISSFQAAFDFVYEEVVTLCPRCGGKIKQQHYPDRTTSDHCGPDDLCWECSPANGKNRG